MRKTHRLLVTSVALASAFALIGCAAEADSPAMTSPPQFGDGESPGTTAPEGSNDQPGDDTPGDDSGSDTDSFDASIAQAIAAIELAEAETNGVAYELDDEDDHRAWKIDVNVGGSDVEVIVNWEGTELMSSREDGSVDRDDLAKLEEASFSMKNAILAAAEETSGRLTAVDLSSENGVVVWEVEFDSVSEHDEVEVYVDASTGEIVRVERD